MHLSAIDFIALAPGAWAPPSLKEPSPMNQHNNHGTSLPHHRLLAYRKSLELLAAVRSAQIRDAKFRDEALRAAKGTCLNIAEGG